MRLGGGPSTRNERVVRRSTVAYLPHPSNYSVMVAYSTNNTVKIGGHDDGKRSWKRRDEEWPPILRACSELLKPIR